MVWFCILLPFCWFWIMFLHLVSLLYVFFHAGCCICDVLQPSISCVGTTGFRCKHMYLFLLYFLLCYLGWTLMPASPSPQLCGSVTIIIVNSVITQVFRRSKWKPMSGNLNYMLKSERMGCLLNNINIKSVFSHKIAVFSQKTVI